MNKEKIIKLAEEVLNIELTETQLPKYFKQFTLYKDENIEIDEIQIDDLTNYNTETIAYQVSDIDKKIVLILK